MIIYKNYRELIESPIIDEYVLSVGKNSYISVILLLLLGGPFGSIFPIISLLIRPYIIDPRIRRAFIWFVIFWMWMAGNWAWITILLTIESVREALRFGVPRLLDNVSKHIEITPSSETMLRRIYRLLREINRRDINSIIFELSHDIIFYSRGDSSEAFDENEKHKFYKFFTDFSKTCFIIDEKQSITIFFPSFVIRISATGMQITNDESIQLIRYPDGEICRKLLPDSNETCAICREDISNIAVKLKCSHKYCLNCIFTWLNRQYTCPVCRGEIS